MTADQENCVLAARSSSKKRASVAPSPELPRLKKRVVLGELTNSSGLGMSQNSPIPKRKLEGENLEFESETRKRKDRSRKERKQDLPQEINTRSGELQKPANSSMYEYLHSLEVRIFTFSFVASIFPRQSFAMNFDFRRRRAFIYVLKS